LIPISGQLWHGPSSIISDKLATDTDTTGLVDMGETVGQQGNVSGALDGGRQGALVPGAGTSLPPRLNVASV